MIKHRFQFIIFLIASQFISNSVLAKSEPKTIELEKRVSALEQKLKEMTMNKCSELTIGDRPNVGFKCITSVGAIIERVERAGFGEAWKTKDGNIWSKNFLFFPYLESEQCKKLGKDSHLPSKEEYVQLQYNFELDKHNPTFLSKKGREDMYGVFSDMYGYWFWSSTPYPCYHNNCVYDFGGAYGKISFGSQTSRNGEAVRCVGKE